MLRMGRRRGRPSCVSSVRYGPDVLHRQATEIVLCRSDFDFRRVPYTRCQSRLKWHLVNGCGVMCRACICRFKLFSGDSDVAANIEGADCVAAFALDSDLQLMYLCFNPSCRGV